MACCARCNTLKRDRLLAETGMRLARRPQAPTKLSWVRVAVGHVPEPWVPYLGGALDDVEPAPLATSA